MHHLAGAADGHTPLDADESQGLIPSWVSTREDLDRVEQDGIAKTVAWARSRRLKPMTILNEGFLRQLHKHMFGDVWTWASHYRATVKNIGVDPAYIGQELAQLIGDALYWVEHDTYSEDETAVRLHHKLVWIHPFPNGNGRHSRLAADLLVQSLGERQFSWGETLAADRGVARATYIAALRRADEGEIGPLLEFARR